MVAPGHGGGRSDTGRAYLEKLGTDELDALLKKVIASIACFKQLNEAELQDVAADAIERVLRNKRLDPSNQPVAYIKKIARNMVLRKLSQLKKDGESVLMDNSDLNALTCTTVEAGEADQGQDLEARASHAIKGIPSDQEREVTERRAYGEPSEDVAVSLGISKQQVYTQYNRGLAKVRAAPQVSPFVRAAHVQSAGRKRPAKDGE
ncbi:sigma-70 family RNA polymerase sigma factor [[Kitasatospora] papulosa]|uniref:sigma-70 family RNA polymerase sigma factor n=1 Tax=Streptomyces TaxID=1883 RepID=UPI000BC92636|nr:RNA polymerase sigma factor (sigma-70 family) [Streptomyces avidinii]SNX80873.1 RNA polymerase sigma factor, sigma-70 family [Streptomyces microflavus]